MSLNNCLTIKFRSSVFVFSTKLSHRGRRADGVYFVYFAAGLVDHCRVHTVQRACRGRINGGGCDINALGLLPDKLKTELALHVNLETLKKVSHVVLIFCRYVLVLLSNDEDNGNSMGV